MTTVCCPNSTNTLCINVPMKGLIAYQGTGSYFICDPPTLDTDKDILLLVKNIDDYKYDLLQDGWEGCTGYEDKEPHFFAARDGDINLIVTEELQWYLRFAAATELAKKMNLLKKEERVALFEQILGDEIKNTSTTSISTSIPVISTWPGIRVWSGGGGSGGSGVY